MRLVDCDGGGNLGMLFYNPANLLERYNAPDSLKCQHTFKITQGHCLYSDMGRVFCSVIADDLGWHDTVCGTTNREIVAKRWGERSYQEYRNHRYLNGFDSFLVEIAKYGLGKKDLAANLNLFSKVETDEEGHLRYVEGHSTAGSSIELRFEMETLVVMNSCPHPLNSADKYPKCPIAYEIYASDPVAEDDECRNSRPENRRGFTNNELYHLGLERTEFKRANHD